MVLILLLLLVDGALFSIRVQWPGAGWLQVCTIDLGDHEKILLTMSRMRIGEKNDIPGFGKIRTIYRATFFKEPYA